MEFRVRVDLAHASPPIRRRLEPTSSMFLDEVHQVLQMAFGWSDSHLHRFALGPSVWDEISELFLCPFDVAEGEDDGVPASGVRIDEVLADVGDELLYVYDYGDEWELRIRLESVVDRAPGAVRAVCTGGRRGAPPENCGGIYAYDDAVTEPGVEQADAFDAGTYVALTEAMNSHDVGPSPETVARRLRWRQTDDRTDAGALRAADLLARGLSRCDARERIAVVDFRHCAILLEQ